MKFSGGTFCFKLKKPHFICFYCFYIVRTPKNGVFFNIKQNVPPENFIQLCFNGKWPGKVEFSKNMRGPRIQSRFWKFHILVIFDVKKLLIQKILVCVKHHWPWSNWIKREKKFTPQTWCVTCSFVNMVKTPKIGPKTELSHHSPSFGLRAKVNMVSCTPGQVVLVRLLN